MANKKKATLFPAEDLLTLSLVALLGLLVFFIIL